MFSFRLRVHTLFLFLLHFFFVSLPSLSTLPPSLSFFLSSNNWPLTATLKQRPLNQLPKQPNTLMNRQKKTNIHHLSINRCSDFVSIEYKTMSWENESSFGKRFENAGNSIYQVSDCFNTFFIRTDNLSANAN